MSFRDRASATLMRVGGLCMIAAGVMVVVPALAPSSSVTVLPDLDTTAHTAATVAPVDAAAVALLARAATATRTKAWQGTQLVTVFGPTAVNAMVDVAHLPGVGSWTTVRSTAHATGGKSFEPESILGPTGQPADWLSLVNQHYTVRRDGQVGATTEELLLQRSDGTDAARFSIDTVNNLIVGRQIYDLTGKLLRASTFSDLDVTDPASLAAAGFSSATAGATPTSDERQLATATLDAWRASGWTVPEEVHADFDLVDARASGTGPNDPTARLHLTYSDGLSSVSVFGERGRLVPSTLVGWHRSSRSSWPVVERTDVHDQVTWSDGTRVWTIVADAPSAVVDRTVAALPHQRNRDAYAQRFSGGLSRIGSWLNPFD